MLERWLPRLLFVATLGASVALAGLLVTAALFAGPDSPRFWRLFAQDAVVRRTSIACAVGLFVTAFVFFRPVFLTKKNSRLPPPGSVAGA